MQNLLIEPIRIAILGLAGDLGLLVATSLPRTMAVLQLDDLKAKKWGRHREDVYASCGAY